MRALYSVEAMRQLERLAARTLGLSDATLMAHAGQGAARAIVGALPGLGAPRRGARVALLCGKGGNGGDGFVAARALRELGLRPTVLLCASRDDVTGAARTHLGRLRGARVPVVAVSDARALARVLGDAHVVVDALLGIGARGAPTGLVADAIARANASGRPIVALDVPSGLDPDTGTVAGAVIGAALTVSFGAVKLGLVLPEGRGPAGEVVVAPLGIPEATVRAGTRVFALEAVDLSAWFPRRPPASHKGTFGHVLIVAGSLGRTGAAVLAARGALRSGSGLVTVATAASQQPIVAAGLAEAMTAALPEGDAGAVGLPAVAAIETLAGRATAVVVGPGLGLTEEARAVARELARRVPVPSVLDADALTALAGRLDSLSEARAPRCLTPHPREMARLLETSGEAVQGDRLGAALEAARRSGAVVALKGAATVTATPDGRIFVNTTGNPGLASGGTGDVLAGMAGACLGRGLSAEAALPAAVYLHGLAGDIAAGRLGEESMLASDVAEALGAAFTRVRDAAAPAREVAEPTA